MSWWGTLIGGYIGFALGGPLGALLGASIGHHINNNSSSGSTMGQQNRAQAAFFTATFSVMGHLCKADDRVTADEIRVAETIMSQMDLLPEQRKAAIDLFNQGTRADFPLEKVLCQLKSELGMSKNIKRVFIEIQCAAAYADNILHPAEKELLEEICHFIGFSKYELNSILAAIAAEKNHAGSSSVNRSARMNIKDAYAILNIGMNTDNNEIKRAYRRLISQHHPDKLMSKGLPEEMIKIANQKTQEIRTAYETIMNHRKHQ